MKPQSLTRAAHAGSPKRQSRLSSFFINAFFVLFSLTFLLPLLMIVGVSLSNENDVIEYGYKLIPMNLDFTAYKLAFSKPDAIGGAYLVTTAFTLLGVLLSLIVMTMLAYTLSRRQFFLRRQLSFLVFFTMLFGGGLVPTYIVNTQVYKLGDSFFIYILPSLCSAFQIIILRTFFKELPEPLFESAKIDGASEVGIFFRIVLPLSTPAIATIAVMGILNRWNDWYTAMIYIRDPKLYSLQYLLQKIILEMNWLIDNFRR